METNETELTPDNLADMYGGDDHDLWLLWIKEYPLLKNYIRFVEIPVEGWHSGPTDQFIAISHSLWGPNIHRVRTTDVIYDILMCERNRKRIELWKNMK